MMGKWKFNIKLIIYSVLGFFLLSGYAEAQNTGYIASSIEDEMIRQQVEQAIAGEDGETLTGVNFNYIEKGIYTLGVDDVIRIEVMRHPEVSGEFLVNKDGKIQYGFVGDILIAGLNKQGVRDLITETIAEYIVSPDVTITITGFFSKVVYVVGEVGRPGKIFMRGDTITVRQALIEAALPLLTGKLTKSSIITPAEDGNAKIKKINVKKLLYKGDLRENYVMRPGDTLYIPPTVMTKAMRAIQPITAPINQGAGTASSVYGF